jgi:hypothetical protein
MIECIEVSPNQKCKPKDDETFQNVRAISSISAAPRLAFKPIHIGNSFSSNSSYRLLKTIFGDIVIYKVAYHVQLPDAHHSITKPTAVESKTIVFRPVKPISSRGFQFQVRCIQGFRSYNIRPVHIVPDDALVFEFCREGDLNNIQRLFSKGLASPFDTNSNGATLLHVCL